MTASGEERTNKAQGMLKRFRGSQTTRMTVTTMTMVKMVKYYDSKERRD